MSELPGKSDLPRELIDTDRFIIWFEEKRGDKLTKIPSAPWKTGHFGSASVTDPENWADFDTAVKYAGRKGGYGVGLCFSEEDDIIGIDLDDCINEEGEVEEWASDIINSASSFTELSPSEKGIHIFLRGKIPRAIKQNEEGVEAYNSKRFFTLTGRSLKKGRGVLRENQEFLNELWERYGEEDIVIEHELEKSGLDFPITKLFETGHLDKDKFRKVGSEYRGSHPIHGSTTGTNLNINPEKNTWICRRHGCGGGSLSLLGVLERVFECGSWGKGETPLRGEKWFKTLRKAEDYGLITEEDIRRWKEPEEVRLSDLQAELIDHPIRVRGQIVGEDSGKATPRVVRATCSKCNTSCSVELSLRKSAKLLEVYLFKGEKRVRDYLKSIFTSRMGACNPEGEKHEIRVGFTDYSDYAILLVRDLMKNIRGDQRAYEPKEIHLVGDSPPDSKKVELTGKVVLNPKSEDIVIIADSIKPLETEIASFEITPEDKLVFPKYFSDRENEIHKEVAPHIVGESRHLPKRWLVRALHSPPEIPDIHGRKIRGIIQMCFFGDTSAGKTETAKDFTDAGDFSIPLGVYDACETGGRTGILYTIDADRRALIWGDLVLNDLGFVVLDGINDIASEEMAELREVLRTGRVSVRKTVSGDAWARTRIVACFNPDSPMNEQLHACQGITDTRAFERSPEITRWDLYLPFNFHDVDGKTIAGAEREDRPIPPEVFYRHVLWAWSRDLNQIGYTQLAKKRIKDKAEELLKNYSVQSLPIVSNESFNTICRFAVAEACMRHSTNADHSKIIVEPEHVRDVVEDYVRVLESLELDLYKKSEDEKLGITLDEFDKLFAELGEVELRILKLVSKHPYSAGELAGELGDISERSVREHYKPLKGHGFIKSKRGVGIELTPRGVVFLRMLRGQGKELSQESLLERILSIYRDAGVETEYELLKILREELPDEDPECLEESLHRLKEKGEITLIEKLGE